MLTGKQGGIQEGKWLCCVGKKESVQSCIRCISKVAVLIYDNSNCFCLILRILMVIIRS